MKAYTLVVSALAIGSSLPAMAQQSMHRYVAFFKYSETAVKAMTETRKIARLKQQSWPRASAARWKLPIGSRLVINMMEWSSGHFQTT
jgi:hypothetical protein